MGFHHECPGTQCSAVQLLPQDPANQDVASFHPQFTTSSPVYLLRKFGLCSELDDALCDAPARHRVRRAVMRWAPGSVLVVALSSMAIVVGAGPYASAATRSFCAFAGASALLGWVTQVGAIGQSVPHNYSSKHASGFGRPLLCVTTTQICVFESCDGGS